MTTEAPTTVAAATKLLRLIHSSLERTGFDNRAASLEECRVALTSLKLINDLDAHFADFIDERVVADTEARMAAECSSSTTTGDLTLAIRAGIANEIADIRERLDRLESPDPPNAEGISVAIELALNRRDKAVMDAVELHTAGKPKGQVAYNIGSATRAAVTQASTNLLNETGPDDAEACGYRAGVRALALVLGVDVV